MSYLLATLVLEFVSVYGVQVRRDEYWEDQTNLQQKNEMKG